MKKEFKPYYDKLHETKQEFLQQYQNNEDMSRPRIEENIGDMVDQATDDYTKEFLSNLSAVDLKTLRRIDQALDRINNEEYGMCQDCGEEITSKRLKAVPWAEYCIYCQEKREKEDLSV